MSAPETQQGVEVFVPWSRIEKVIGWLNEKTGRRCISCDHVLHNELAYCQTASCSCSTGTEVGSNLRMLKRHAITAEALAAQVPEDVARAVRTLLPGLRGANYIERWSPQSPAVQALKILCEFVGEPVEVAGDLIDPHVPTAHPTRPEGLPPAQVVPDDLAGRVRALIEEAQ